MIVNINKEKFRFWIKWTLVNALVLILGYIVSGFFVLLINEVIFGLTMSEWGTPFEQSIMQIAAGTVIGFSMGITQWLLLRKVFDVSSLWIYSVAIGFVIIELFVGIILWKLDINRGDLSFIEGKPLAHALILGITGLLISLIQLPLLRKHYSGNVYWVISSTLAWGISVLLTAIFHQSELAILITFVLGAILYGAITGATLIGLPLYSVYANLQSSLGIGTAVGSSEVSVT